MRAAEGPLPLVVSVHVALQVEAAGEAFGAALLGAQELPLLPRVGAQVVLVQEPAVAEELCAASTRHLGCRDKEPHLNGFRGLNPTPPPLLPALILP